RTDFRTPSLPWHVFLTRAGIHFAIIRGFRPEQVEKQHRPACNAGMGPAETAPGPGNAPGSRKRSGFPETPRFPGNARVSRNLSSRRRLVSDHGGTLSWPTNPIRTIPIVSRTILTVLRSP